MASAIVVRETGGPDVLELDDVSVDAPGPGEVRVRVEAAGVNFIDTYQRAGAYPLDLPTVLGLEGAGTVEEVGDGTGFDIGQRVAWTGVQGSYATEVVAPADQLVAVPDGVDTTDAAAVMLQGMTAHYLSASTFPLEEGHVAVVYAAAGGVGGLLVQLAKRRGAHVVGTASTEEKAELAREAGADEVIRYTDVDLEAAVRDAHPDGVDVVYDSVGRDTFEASLGILRRRGMLVLYGQSSGAVEPLDPQVLNRRGSLFLTRPSLFDYAADAEELRWRAGEVLGLVASGDLTVRIDRTWPLAEAADAHRHLEGRKSRGKLVLLP